MSESNFYWLRLHRDFFKRHDIRIIEDMDNGKDYILFYLKLLVESIDHEGNLRFSELIPYNEKMLATVTNTNVDTVRGAMEIFTRLGMITILDDQTIFMNEVSNMIGESIQDEHTRESTRLRVQKYRERQKLIGSSDKDVTLPKRYSNVTCNGEIEIEKEIEIDKDNMSGDIESIIAYLNEKCGTHYQTSTPKTRTLIKARTKEGFTVDDFKTVIDKKSSEWLSDTKMRAYLRPETLFGTKFEGYLNQTAVAKAKPTSFGGFSNKQDYDFEAIEKMLVN